MLKAEIKYFLFFLTAAVLSSCQQTFEPAAANENAFTAIESYFDAPEKKLYTLSEDGEKLAFLKKAPDGYGYLVCIREVGSEIESALTESISGTVKKMHFVGGKLILLVDYNANHKTKLFMVDVESGNFLNLTPYDDLRVRLVSIVSGNTNEILISHNQRDPRSSDVYRLNLNTGKMTMVAESPGNILFWLADRFGQIRAAMVSDGSGSSLMYRENGSSEFRTIQKTSFNHMLWPIEFCPDNKCFYAFSNVESDNRSLVIYDPEKGVQSEELFNPPGVDLYECYYSEQSGKIALACYIDDYMEFELLDENYRALYEVITKQLKGKNVYIKSKDKGENTFILYADSDSDPGTYYLFNKTSGILKNLSEPKPELATSNLSSSKYITYNSSDGKAINAYLFMPTNGDTVDIPFVLFFDKSIMRRYTRNFEPMVQYLAKNGYGVMLANYRGKYGYGCNFMKCASGQWGKMIINDVFSGAEFLIDKGYTSSGKIGLYGGGFGSLVIMNSLTKYPELFGAAVSENGLYDLECFLGGIPEDRQAYLELLYDVFGDPVKDSAMIHEVSPVHHLNKLQAPVMFMHDSVGWLCELDIVDGMIESLESQDKDVDRFIVSNIQQYLSDKDNAISYYSKVERFFDRHLRKKVALVD